MDLQPVLSDGILSLRPLQAGDRAALQAAASDPEIWAGHPVKDRYKSEVFAPYFDQLLGSGGTLVVCETDGGKIVGCSRYYVSEDAPQDIGIGFTFLVRAHWGGASNWRIKRMMLDHAFASHERVWFHIGPNNIRSQMATIKLGATDVGIKDLSLSGKVDTWRVFCLTRGDWPAR